jgi:glutamate carboxypeptidase
MLEHMTTHREALMQAAEHRAAWMHDALEKLVGYESPSADLPALHRCTDLLADLGAQLLDAAPQRPTADGRPCLLWGYPGTPRILLLGHLDTVWPLGTIDDWPYQVRDGIASGPGVFDMKAGLVIALTAISLLDDPGGVTLLVTSDEEIGSPASRPLIEQRAAGADAVLVCEPSADGGAVKTARKGVAHYLLRVTGRAAHAGLEPELGVNAGVELAHQVLALAEIARPEHGTTVTPTRSHAGSTANTVPETAELHIDARAWTAAEMRRVDHALHNLKPITPGATLDLTGVASRGPFEPSASAGLLEHAQAAATDLGLRPLSGVRSAGGSDGNLTAALGIPTLDGLGAVGAHPHGRDEHVELATLPTRAAFLALLIDRIRTLEAGLTASMR